MKIKNRKIEEKNITQQVIYDYEVLDLNHQIPALIEIPLIEQHIKEIYLFRNKISIIQFKNNLNELINLNKIDLSDNKIKNLIDFSDIPNLHTLDLSFNLLESIPLKISDVAKEIYLHCNDITDSNELCYICDTSSNNKEIEYFEYKIKSLNLKKLDLASNSLHKFPILETPNLEELYISSNHLTEIPNFFKNLKNLKILGIEKNHFIEIDCSILPNSIESLILSDNNELKKLKNIDLLINLTYLDIENTKISELNIDPHVEVLISSLK